MNGWKLMAIGLAVSTAAGAALAADFCRSNPYTKAEAAQGKVLFDSHCALCHQYSMVGREPGNDKNESPDINLLSAIGPLVGWRAQIEGRDPSPIAKLDYQTTDLRSFARKIAK